MFLQVFQGRLADQESMERQMERWHDELASAAAGWLGTTGGSTAADDYVAVVRFESEDAARANSDRREQREWWAETEKCFDETPTFKDYTNVETFMQGGSDDAGFVQIIQGRAKDVGLFKESVRWADQELGTRRPDVVGGIAAWRDDGDFTQVVYFKSEADARAGERAVDEDETGSSRQEWFANLEDLTYHDLTKPRMWSP